MRLKRDYILRLAVEISLGSDIPSATVAEYEEAAALLRAAGVIVPADEKPKTMGASA